MATTGAPRSCPARTLWQIFVYDPSGVMLELTFDGRAENRADAADSRGRAVL